mgnify:CR=1 FL=1
MPKTRADQLLVDRGLAESRTRAQALVMAGLVFTGDRKVEKPGQQLPGDAPLDVRGRDHPWVSRGGIKLAHAIDHFGLDPAGAVAMDIGSSTGGTTVINITGPTVTANGGEGGVGYGGAGGEGGSSSISDITVEAWLSV